MIKRTPWRRILGISCPAPRVKVAGGNIRVS